MRLHADKMNVGNVCLLRFLQQDIDWTEVMDRLQGATFDWKCKGCGKRHLLQVDELDGAGASFIGILSALSEPCAWVA